MPPASSDTATRMIPPPVGARSSPIDVRSRLIAIGRAEAPMRGTPDGHLSGRLRAHEDRGSSAGESDRDRRRGRDHSDGTETGVSRGEAEKNRSRRRYRENRDTPLATTGAGFCRPRLLTRKSSMWRSNRQGDLDHGTNPDGERREWRPRQRTPSMRSSIGPLAGSLPAEPSSMSASPVLSASWAERSGTIGRESTQPADPAQEPERTEGRASQTEPRTCVMRDVISASIGPSRVSDGG